jgi:hypothetical protein
LFIIWQKICEVGCRRLQTVDMCGKIMMWEAFPQGWIRDNFEELLQLLSLIGMFRRKCKGDATNK